MAWTNESCDVQQPVAGGKTAGIPNDLENLENSRKNPGFF